MANRRKLGRPSVLDIGLGPSVSPADGDQAKPKIVLFVIGDRGEEWELRVGTRPGAM